MALSKVRWQACFKVILQILTQERYCTLSIAFHILMSE